MTLGRDKKGRLTEAVVAHKEAVQQKLISSANEILPLEKAEITRVEDIQWAKRDMTNEHSRKLITTIWLHRTSKGAPYKIVEGRDTALKMKVVKREPSEISSASKTKKRRRGSEGEAKEDEADDLHHDTTISTTRIRIPNLACDVSRDLDTQPIAKKSNLVAVKVEEQSDEGEYKAAAEANSEDEVQKLREQLMKETKKTDKYKLLWIEERRKVIEVQLELNAARAQLRMLDSRTRNTEDSDVYEDEQGQRCVCI